MKTTFTQDYLIENRGCYDLKKVKSLSFMQKEVFTIEDIVSSEIPLKDKYWFVTKKCDLTIHEKQKIAIGVAEIVLHIYENKYPNDNRPREAIQAAKDYLSGNISREELIIKRRAAYAASAYAASAYAYDAAYAAASADYAASAYAADDAYAAASADYAASAYAADDAYDAYDAYAAYAAAYAAAYDTLNESLYKYLLDFVKSKNEN